MGFLRRNLTSVTPGTYELSDYTSCILFCFQGDFGEILSNSSHAKNVKTVSFDFVNACFVHYKLIKKESKVIRNT